MAAGYDIGCIYPETMPDPLEARLYLHQFSGSYLMAAKIETPVVIHVASLSSLCQVGCLAYHDETMLDVITQERPLASIPSEYHNAWSRVLCMAQCFAIISHEAGQPEFYQPLWEKWGLQGIEPRRDAVGLGVLVAQQGDPVPLEELLEREDYHPYIVGQIVATEALLHVVEDGWNALGEFTYDMETGEPVECTANCERYKDTTGYFPKNHPTGKPENGTSKYVVEGKDKYWQPLADNDGNGFFSAQEHVTPHIGYTAKPKLYDSVDDFPQAPDPEYNYYEDALEVVERLRETSSDPIKKQKIAFFDNKLLVINLIEAEVKKKFISNYSFEDEILFIEGLSAGEHDATLMAWREKVRHDLVRPTTVIQRWGSDILETFGGDKTMDGPAKIAARDFEAFQRVMPHSEYPSGSSCICTAYAEFADAFTKEYYNQTVTDLPFGGAGEGTGFGCDPELDPPLLASFGCDSDFVIPDMKTLIYECGQSRLWAGFHFTKAVTEGEKMCAGLGLRAFDHIQKTRNGSTLGNKFYRGDARPQCSNPGAGATTVVSKDVVEESAAKPVEFWTLLFAATAPLLVFLM